MSSEGELSATTLTGVDQGAPRDGRCATQTSMAPTPPARSDPNHSVSPSAEMAALVSKPPVLTASTAWGAPKASEAVARVANQTSPLPLSRSVVK